MLDLLILFFMFEEGSSRVFLSLLLVKPYRYGVKKSNTVSIDVGLFLSCLLLEYI